MKIVFLDIDGVLNSTESFLAFGPCHISDDFSTTRLNPVSVRLVARIVSECNAEVYVHSSWGRTQDFEWFAMLFARYGVDIPLLSHRTDREYVDNRSARIDDAINVFNPESYIVIDDDGLSLSAHRHRLVAVNNDRGFGLREYHKARELMGLPKDERRVMS
jgi:hypothetical protein